MSLTRPLTLLLRSTGGCGFIGVEDLDSSVDILLGRTNFAGLIKVSLLLSSDDFGLDKWLPLLRLLLNRFDTDDDDDDEGE